MAERSICGVYEKACTEKCEIKAQNKEIKRSNLKYGNVKLLKVPLVVKKFSNEQDAEMLCLFLKNPVAFLLSFICILF